ncbi:GHKL domain-containing protein [Sedimentibacter hydroxybenzoicus DSM 7310]|uniref:GHKL domain-containing protein n=1 Tax=Sedimentibacter hydroxybenzoicus DSM 7310 TaxID=1123245 RepID=A0A974BKT8_SEDHY|nr:sensor histidine kinase [Sedimentibacter hydroxybenzoicus]NYB75004.1 GHKL domain-containing protein [Sedimentibacter hydroxybenzoicus DSM 7310]
MSSYEITYVISSIFGTYIIYKMLKLFFDERRTSIKAEAFSYIAYYFINLLIFFTVRKPIVLLIINITLFFCLSLNYRSSLAKKIIFSVLSFIALMLIETLVVALTGYFAIPVFGYSEYDSSLGLVLIRILSMLLVTILTNLKNIKNDIPVPNFYWFSTIFVSVASLYQFISFFTHGSFNNIEMIILIISILGINFAILFLYDTLYLSFSAKTEKILLEQQNNAYAMQLDIMQQSLDSLQTVRHDIKNHMIVLKNLNSAEGYTKFDEYVDKIISSVDGRTLYSNSENVIVDSILNYKLQAVTNMDVELQVDVSVPKKLSISSYDMTIILGNLTDNAITALKKCSGENFLSVKISYCKGSILITVANTYNGEVKEKNGTLLTSKEDEKNHGIGLRNVEEAVNRNNGHMKINYDDKEFKVNIILPLL